MPDLTDSASAAWKAVATTTVRLFHRYGQWLAGISWWRFLLGAVLLMILANVLESLPPFRRSWREAIEDVPPTTASTPPKRRTPPGASTDSRTEAYRSSPSDEGVVMSIDSQGVRIAPRGAAQPASAAAAGASLVPAPAAPPATAISIVSAGSASSAAATASATGTAATAAFAANASAASSGPAASSAPDDDGSIEIALPGATRETLRAVVRAARSAAREAAEASRETAEASRQDADTARRAARQAVDEARRDAEDARRDAAEANARVRQYRHTHITRAGDSLTDLAFFWIIASALLKVTYKGRVQAEVKAAEATEAAESEQLRRQVVEARMAAMQAQVEPHFLFNTLASIDHLIETDPARASRMQKNLITMLRASMPTMRENHPTAHNLGREMAVIRPYLEILKVRMEDRLQTVIDVPAGLLSADFPSMMIQSLVENAIRHGLEPKAEGGLLTVRAEIVHGRLAVTVADTGLGFGRAATAGTGTGLANIRERLQLLYGDKAAVVIAENVPCGTVVTLTVPYQARTDSETA